MAPRTATAAAHVHGRTRIGFDESARPAAHLVARSIIRCHRERIAVDVIGFRNSATLVPFGQLGDEIPTHFAIRLETARCQDYTLLGYELYVVAIDVFRYDTRHRTVAILCED